MDNHNFGIEQLPQSENVTVNIASPTGNPTLTITAGTITDVIANAYVTEQSLDGRIFRSVGLLQATEPVAGVKEYNIVDKDAAASNFYRIRQVDRDGKYAYSKTITVNCESGRLQVQLYPNPAAHKITFEYQNAQEGQLDISHLSDAVYYFHYRLPGTKSAEVIKFTKTVK